MSRDIARFTIKGSTRSLHVRTKVITAVTGGDGVTTHVYILGDSEPFHISECVDSVLSCLPEYQ